MPALDGTPSGPSSILVDEARIARLATLDPSAPLTTNAGLLPDRTPFVVISQRSHRLDIVESDVIIPIHAGIQAFCSLLAASIGMQVTFTPLQMTGVPK